MALSFFTNILTSTHSTHKDFKNEHSFEERHKECTRIKSKYTDRLPIICQRIKNANESCPIIDKKKYLIPNDLTLGQFIYVIRKRCNLNESQSLYFTVNGSIYSSGRLLREIYNEHKDDDGFLYMYYNTENTFGNDS